MGDQEGAAAQPGVLEAAWLERAGYEDMWAWQRRRFEARRAGECNDMVALLEHPPTYTLGRRSTSEEISFTPPSNEGRSASPCSRSTEGAGPPITGPAS